MRFLKTTLLIILCSFSISSFAQDLNATVKGRVVEEVTGFPLPGASIISLGESSIGTVTDEEGYFRMSGFSAGRVSIRVSFMGFETVELDNLVLSPAKELVINIEMKESINTLQEVEVTAAKSEMRTNNELVQVSGRTFSIEESQRFAGARQDVSRLASNFAGVRASNDAVNDIVIRGNSPFGLIWRMEGIDIPNPNHFGSFGATGGPVSMLNNNVLANSDFLTAAFPAEYSNGISGVFDLKLRNGNDETHEFLGQVGFNGFELGAEGPINREKHSSYLVNYRYSVLGFMQAIGIDFGTGSALPEYQDINFKVHLPGTSVGTIDVFGMGGISSIDFLPSLEDEPQDDLYTDQEQDVYNRVNTGVMGVAHSIPLSRNSLLRTTLAYSITQNKNTVDTLDGQRSPHARYRNDFVNRKTTLATYWNWKINANNSLKTGAFLNFMNFDLQDSVLNFKTSANEFQWLSLRDESGSTALHQVYSQWKGQLSNRWSATAGVHLQYFALNAKSSLEPRASVRYELNERQSLSAGYGLHGQLAPITTYFLLEERSDGSYVPINSNLGFVKSHHFVVSHDYLLTDKLRLKTEAYYQLIGPAIVGARSSYWSSLNLGSNGDLNAPDSLAMGGRGFNYGLEFTLEQFMKKGFYFLSTLSLFDSKYEGSNGIQKNTAFNTGFIFNLVGGKEFILTKDKNSNVRKSITLDGSFNWSGGARYTPLDIEESALKGEAILDEDRSFGSQFPDFFRLSLRLGYKIQKQKWTQEWAIDVQNVTNRQNPLYVAWNPDTGEEVFVNQLGLFPVFLYRIEF
jgi:hypothetical protein